VRGFSSFHHRHVRLDALPLALYVPLSGGSHSDIDHAPKRMHGDQTPKTTAAASGTFRTSPAARKTVAAVMAQVQLCQIRERLDTSTRGVKQGNTFKSFPSTGQLCKNCGSRVNIKTGQVMFMWCQAACLRCLGRNRRNVLWHLCICVLYHTQGHMNSVTKRAYVEVMRVRRECILRVLQMCASHHQYGYHSHGRGLQKRFRCSKWSS
jgi:uncharacterized protein YlaI